MAAPPSSSNLDGRIMDGVLIIGESNWVHSLQIPAGGFQWNTGGGMQGPGLFEGGGRLR